VEIMTGFALLFLSGCDDPGPIVPIAPPGANVPRISPDEKPAEAQGEAVPDDTGGVPASVAAEAAHKPAPPTAIGETKTTEKGVKYETIQEGTGPELKRGQRATFHYVGRLQKDNSIFDESRRTNRPLTARMGGNPPLIEGWEDALPGMRVGEIRKLTIPPELAYGEKGKSPGVPPNATLIFEIELLSIAAEE
jgi:FKBP-type peptidyl-prolyl cis-trans isomerase FkpA